MKKILLLALLSVTAVYGKTVTLDELINALSKTSYHNDLYERTKENNKVKEKYYKLGDFNGVETSASTTYNSKEKKYESTAKASFGPLFVEGTKAYNEKDDYATIGAEKSIKDLIYSSDKSELKKLDINKKVDELGYKLDLETQKLNLISLYVDYKTNEKEISVKNSGIQKLQTERKKLKTSYDMGGTAKIDLDSVDTSLNNYRLEIKVLQNTMARIKERFYYEYGLDVSKYNLADIQPKDVKIDDLIKEYGYKDVTKQKLEKDVSVENVKYLKYDDKMPEIALGADHNTKNGENRVYLTFSKKFFGYNLELENGKADLDEKEIRLKQAMSENEGAKLSAYNTYDSYLKEYMTNKNSADLENKKYEIKLMEYSAGKSTYLDVMTSFDDYITYKVAMEKAKNKLYGYVYELMIRSEK